MFYENKSCLSKYSHAKQSRALVRKIKSITGTADYIRAQTTKEERDLILVYAQTIADKLALKMFISILFGLASLCFSFVALFHAGLHPATIGLWLFSTASLVLAYRQNDHIDCIKECALSVISDKE